MMYSYDRRAATTSAEVAVSVTSTETIISVLSGPLLAAYKSKNTVHDLGSLKVRIESLTGNPSEILDKAETMLEREGFTLSRDFSDRDKELSRKQVENQKAAERSAIKSLGKWLRSYVVPFVEDIYTSYKRGAFAKEPCITAGYFRDFLISGQVPTEFSEMRSLFRDLAAQKQLAACQYALESAAKSGKLLVSTGLSNGRETKCYEPVRW